MNQTSGVFKLSDKISILDLGRVDYQTARNIQLKLQKLRQDGSVPDILILAEHPPTITIGRDGGFEYILATNDQLIAKGITVYQVERGGSVTYHGPGQLVAYPILDLSRRGKDVHLYIYQLEEVIINLLHHFNIYSARREGYPGVWVNHSKITAIGVAISKWVTMHGLALNVDPDLNNFDLIVPCGIKNAGVTSMARELSKIGQTVPHMDQVNGLFKQTFARVFGYQLVPVSYEEMQVNRLGSILWEAL